jgi:hypothetical protein
MATVHTRLSHGTNRATRARGSNPATPNSTPKLPQSMINACTGAISKFVKKLTTLNRPK